MNFTSFAQMPFSQSPSDDRNSTCGDPSIQTGRFVLEAPSRGAGKLLSLYVPSDFMSSSYTVSVLCIVAVQFVCSKCIRVTILHADAHSNRAPWMAFRAGPVMEGIGFRKPKHRRGRCDALGASFAAKYHHVREANARPKRPFKPKRIW